MSSHVLGVTFALLSASFFGGRDDPGRVGVATTGAGTDGRERAVCGRGRGVMAVGDAGCGTNACYVLATQRTRMDVAVMLSSLYPAVTKWVARVVLAERISGAQWTLSMLALLLQ